MNPIDVARLNVAQRLRADVPAPVSAASPAASARDVTNGTGPGKGASTGVSAVERLSAGAAAPFDAERVAALRETIGQGRYPVIPDRIADAMIAGGHLFKADR